MSTQRPKHMGAFVSFQIDTRYQIEGAPMLTAVKLLTLMSGGSPSLAAIAATSPIAWWDASRSLCTDTGGTTPVIDGASVAYWGDQSGNSYNVTQGTAGNRPVYRASVSSLANRAAVQFTTANSHYLSRSVGAAIAANINAFSVYIVYLTTVSQAQYMYSEGNTGSANQLLGNRTNFGAYEGILRDDVVTTANPAAGITAANGVKCIQTFRRASASSFGLRVNGTQIATAATTPTTTTINQIGIGALLRTAITQFFEGYIAQVIVSNSDNFATIEPILAAYYGITLP